MSEKCDAITKSNPEEVRLAAPSAIGYRVAEGCSFGGLRSRFPLESQLSKSYPDSATPVPDFNQAYKLIMVLEQN